MRGLDRFIAAQAGGVYEQALAELIAGAKRSHWMWFVFPQLAGLGRSATAQFYGLSGGDEAAAYLANPLLGARLGECTNALLSWAGVRSAEVILGPLDALKWRSSMTLFEAVAAEPGLIAAALDSFYGGERDAATLSLLG